MPIIRQAMAALRYAARHATLLTLALSAPRLAAQELTVVQDKAPMFKEASITSPIVKYLEQNSRVNLLAAEDSFYLVSFGGFEGWVIPSSVSGAAPAATEAAETAAEDGTGGYLVVANSFANVREGPGTEYKQIGRVNRGDRLEKFIKRGDWYRVRLPDARIGFVFGALVREEAAAAPSPGGAAKARPVAAAEQRLSAGERIESLERELSRLRVMVAEQAARISELEGRLGGTAPAAAAPSTGAQTTTAAPAQEPPIIGNRATRFYHLPGSAYYDKIPEEFRVYFRSEELARQAGFTRSLR